MSTELGPEAEQFTLPADNEEKFAAIVGALADGMLKFPRPYDLATSAALSRNKLRGALAERVFHEQHSWLKRAYHLQIAVARQPSGGWLPYVEVLVKAEDAPKEFTAITDQLRACARPAQWRLQVDEVIARPLAESALSMLNKAAQLGTREVVRCEVDWRVGISVLDSLVEEFENYNKGV